MTTTINAGYLGFGVAIPEDVRTNEHWGRSYLNTFDQRQARDATTPELQLAAARTPAHRIQLEAMIRLSDDPFRGAKLRRVADKGTKSSELETRAARQAMERAGVRPEELDMILVSSLPADEASPSNAGVLQHALGARNANAMCLDSACASFLSATATAQALTRDGQAKRVLVVVSALHSRLFDEADPASVNFGDGAAAAVIGVVPEGQGVLASVFRTYGELAQAFCLGPRGESPWYNPTERPVAHSRDLGSGRAVVLRTAEYAQETIAVALEQAQVKASDVTRYYSHQPTVWFNEVTRRAAGLEHALTYDTFPELGGMGAANIPVNIFHALQHGQLHGGELVVLYACGAGLTLAASVIRWPTQAQ